MIEAHSRHSACSVFFVVALLTFNRPTFIGKLWRHNQTATLVRQEDGEIRPMRVRPKSKGSVGLGSECCASWTPYPVDTVHEADMPLLADRRIGDKRIIRLIRKRA